MPVPLNPSPSAPCRSSALHQSEIGVHQVANVKTGDAIALLHGFTQRQSIATACCGKHTEGLLFVDALNLPQ